MAYIGIQPAESFTSFATQEFSTSATTSYTLDHAVANENELALFVNNVRQQPGSGKAYTATGTALTLSAATASTDTMYCVFLGRALQTVVPATNSITAAMVGNDLISGKDALASEPADTDEFLVSDAGTIKRIDYSLIKGSGKILQVVEGIDDTEFETTSTSFVATPLDVNITPSSTSSKILVMASFNIDNKGNSNYIYTTLYRDSTNLAVGTEGMQIHHASDGARNYSGHPLLKLDSPNTTSQITYSVYIRVNSSTGRIGQNNLRQSIVAIEVGA